MVAVLQLSPHPQLLDVVWCSAVVVVVVLWRSGVVVVMCNKCSVVAVVVVVTSSTAQGGGRSFKNRKTIGEIGCCESRMAERSH